MRDAEVSAHDHAGQYSQAPQPYRILLFREPLVSTHVSGSHVLHPGGAVVYLVYDSVTSTYLL